ncbi:DUF2282 domain-containing protein [Rhodospira trueperi]|uniref:Uncharacterized membrane protein n=1 Tax=Rhodospira trueperi TaxID=69960 RepID=A0A1G7HYS1_9PROT|nr:DUF2282 domain-containing protein [Rhodospira trueperi]SDF05697.1 Uncharacterized membrane protein [Rhodospira trueperi]
MKITETSTIIAAAMTAALAMAAPTGASAADMEKCYGVAKAGHNDCQTANSSCAGSSTMDGDGHAFIALPEGTCEKLVGGSLEPKES